MSSSPEGRAGAQESEVEAGWLSLMALRAPSWPSSACHPRPRWLLSCPTPSPLGPGLPWCLDPYSPDLSILDVVLGKWMLFSWGRAPAVQKQPCRCRCVPAPGVSSAAGWAASPEGLWRWGAPAYHSAEAAALGTQGWAPGPAVGGTGLRELLFSKC